VIAGTSPDSVTSIGAPTGSATSDEAASPDCQSPTSTKVTAPGPATPPVEGNTASATAAASEIGSGPAMRVVFFVANAGKPRSSVSSGTGTSRTITSGAGAATGALSSPSPSSIAPAAIAMPPPSTTSAAKMANLCFRIERKRREMKERTLFSTAGT
jgi:hypothetical protein